MSLISLDDFEKKAREKLHKTTLQFYESGAGDELTVNLNRICFDRIRIIPRVLRDVSHRDLACSIFGSKFSFPCGIAPSGMHKTAHPEGEIATAKGILGISPNEKSVNFKNIFL
jgi:(S)-2-hydroxy-acid oxidase